MSRPKFEIPKARKYGFNHSDFVDALRALAQDGARSRLEISAISDIVDNTTGVAAAAIVAVGTPANANASGTNLAPKAAFDTAMGKLDDAGASLARTLNEYLGLLGADLLAWSVGTVTQGTIPALDKALAAVDGSGDTGVEAVSGRAALVTARNNFATLMKIANKVSAALGDTTLSDWTGGAADEGGAIAGIAATDAGVDGIGENYSLLDTAVDTELDNLANNYATLLNYLNDLLGVPIADLTDSSGGSATDTAAAVVIPPPFTSAGIDSTPKAGFDTLLGVIGNNIADLAARTNEIGQRFDSTLLTDNSGGTADTTVEAQLAALTALDPTGNDGVEQATAIARIDVIRDNLSTLIARINQLAPEFGLVVITDNSGGTADTALWVLDDVVTATGAGADGTADSTLEDSVTDVALLRFRETVASLAGKLNEMTDAATPTRPLSVVAVP